MPREPEGTSQEVKAGCGGPRAAHAEEVADGDKSSLLVSEDERQSGWKSELELRRQK